MRANIRLRTRIVDGNAVALMTLPTKNGPITLRSAVPVEYVSRRIQQRYLAGTGRTQVGWGFFKKISKKAKKFAKKIAKSKVLKSALKIANNPIVSSFLPGSAVTALRYLEKGRRLVEKANQGDKGAKGIVAQVRAQAAFRANPTPWNFRAAQLLQKRNSRRLGRPVGAKLFSVPLSRAIQACAA